MRCDRCGAEISFPELHGPNLCTPIEEPAPESPKPMSLAEIVAAFENAKNADEVFALLKDTDAPADPIDQQLIRYKLKPVFEHWKITVGAIDQWFKVKDAERVETEIQFPHHPPHPHPVNGAELIADLEAYIARFVDAPPESILAACLWAMWTHVYDLFDIAPQLVMTSPTKKCGKTTLLRLVAAVSARRLFSSNITGPALFRVIEKYHPTLVIDEADNFATFNDELKGLLNAGHMRDTAQVTRTVGEKYDPKTFSTWSPKAFTAIGSLPDTIEDRSVLIVMRPIALGLRKERARNKVLRAAGDPIASRCVRWAQDNAFALRAMEEPDLPQLEDSRAADNWAPLIMVAELCGVKDRAIAAAVSLTGNEETSVAEQLLAHLKDVYGGESWMATKAILEALVDHEDGPWAKFWADDVHSDGGLKKASADLARRLRKFVPGIKATQKTVEGKQVRGYEREVFEDVWSRWLPPIPPTG